MVYECDQCSAPLSAGVIACSRCGEQFDEAVPADAELPKRGFSAVDKSAPTLTDNPTQQQDALPPAIFSASPATPASKLYSSSPWNQSVSLPKIVAMLVLAGIVFALFREVSNTEKSTSSTATPTVAASAPLPSPSTDTSTSSDSDNSASPASDNASPLIKGSEHFSKESDFDIVAGEITNTASINLDDVEAVTTFYDNDGNVVKTSDALIDFNPLMPGQTSSYKTMEPDNPSIKTEKTEFHTMGGPLIPYTLKDASHSESDSDTTSDSNRDPVSGVATSGSGLSDQPLKRNVLENTTVTEDDLTGKSLSALSISYNTIYAVHGYVFQRRSLQQVFDKMPWYHSNPAFSESDLNQLERGNLKTIRDYERKVYHY